MAMIVEYVGFLNERSGYGAAARRHALALRAAGVEVQARCVTLAGSGPHRVPLAVSMFPELRALSESEGSGAIQILHCYPRHFQALRSTDTPRSIGLVAWETDESPKSWRQGLQSVDSVWAPSSFCARALARGGAESVEVVPHPVSVPNEERRCLDFIPADQFLFLAVMAWNDRKNPQGLIRAFKRAFRGREDVALLLKLNSVFGRSPRRAWRELGALCASLSGHPAIYVVDEPLSQASLHLLYARADAYASLHRAEGFGMAVADAMAMGLPTLVTNTGGILDYANERTAFLVPCRDTPVRERYMRAPYEDGMTWAEPHQDAAVDALRWCHRDADARTTRATRAKACMQEAHPLHVGERMKELLCNLLCQS